MLVWKDASGVRKAGCRIGTLMSPFVTSNTSKKLDTKGTFESIGKGYVPHPQSGYLGVRGREKI